MGAAAAAPPPLDELEGEEAGLLLGEGEDEVV